MILSIWNLDIEVILYCAISTSVKLAKDLGSDLWNEPSSNAQTGPLASFALCPKNSRSFMDVLFLYLMGVEGKAL